VPKKRKKMRSRGLKIETGKADPMILPEDYDTVNKEFKLTR